jgi:hypothetical protein
MELKIENSEGLVLWTGAGDLVQLPMDRNERAQCRKLLLDSLDLLNQTIVKQSTISMVGETDQGEIQSPQHLSDCRAVYVFSRSSKQPKGREAPKLQLVFGDPQ